MSTLSPPIPLELTENEARVNYVQDVASQPYFDYPPVRWRRRVRGVWCGAPERPRRDTH